MLIYYNCACALTENSNYDLKSVLVIFSLKLHADVHWNILHEEALYVLSLKERI